MPRTAVPYRAYFIGRTFITWFDSAADGGRTWSTPVPRNQLWPSLRDPFSNPAATQFGAYPVSGTVVKFADDKSDYQYVDVDKGSVVPDPRTVEPPALMLGGVQPVTFALPVHVVSWDAGPILMAPNVMGSPANTITAVDLRDFSMGTPQPTSVPAGLPTLAIPGEPVRWFTADTPQQVVSLGTTPDSLNVPAGTGLVNQPISTVFPGLPANDQIVDATIMYGSHTAVLAEATAGLTDIEVRAIVGVAPKFGASGAQVLAMLYLLSGLRFDAYHPSGSYGIAAMTTDQLRAAGWTDQTDPTEQFPDSTDQIGFLLAYLGTFPTWHADIVWPLAVLLSGQAVDNLNDTTVVLRAPYPPRLRGVAALDADGAMGEVVTVGDLRAAINGVLQGPLGWELTARAAFTTLA